MFSGIALPVGDLPLELIDHHALGGRLHDCGSQQEFRFLLQAGECVLPAWLDGQLQILRWGNKRQQSRVLPPTAWTWLQTLESGAWAQWEPQPVVIPATMGVDNGVWFHVIEGVRGVAVRDEKGQAVVYVLCEPASHYYEVMTRSPWMPVLIGERI